MWSFFDVTLIVAGYVASIYSWPVVKLWINGARAGAARLRAKAMQLESKVGEF
jgi:hypothetical protein